MLSIKEAMHINNLDILMETVVITSVTPSNAFGDWALFFLSLSNLSWNVRGAIGTVCYCPLKVSFLLPCTILALDKCDLAEEKGVLEYCEFCLPSILFTFRRIHYYP